eukprot:374168_1
MAPVLLLTYLMAVLCQSYALVEFSYGAATLPYSHDDFALWFNQTSDEIIIIPTTATDNVLLFDTTDHSFSSETPPPTDLEAFSLSKTFIGDTLYLNGYLDENIATYKLSTNQYTEPMDPSITTPVDFACLTSDDRYVYVLGGLAGSPASAVRYFQIFDSDGNQWQPFQGSVLRDARFSSACEMYQGTIYVFGGQPDQMSAIDTIEKYYVGQGDEVLNNIADDMSGWDRIAATLFTPKAHMATA